MKEVKLIGISGKMASGKDTLADLLEESLEGEVYSISFGKLIRLEIQDIMKSNEEGIDLVSRYKADKEDLKTLIETLGENDIFNRSPEARKALQFWGSGVRRKQDENYWINKMRETIESKLAEGNTVCLSDARFPVEVELVEDLGGIVLRVEVDEETQIRRIKERDGIDVSEDALKHRTETALDNYDFKHIIKNDKDIDYLLEQVMRILKDN